MPSLKKPGLLLAFFLVFGAVGFPTPVRAGRAAEVRTEAFRLLNQGVSAYRRGEFAVAVEKLRRSAGLSLNSFRAYYYLGLALIGDRRYAEAIEALGVALDLDPAHLQSLVAMGDARLKQGDLDEARASYFRALKLRPEYAPALDGLARIYDAQGAEEQAVTHFRRSIASDAGYAPGYTHLGDLYLRHDQFEEAVELLEEATAVRPDFAEGLNRLALAYGRLGLDNQAVATIRTAMELEPNQASHPATLGWLQLGQDLVALGEQWFLRALELDPVLPDARMGLAEVARRRGNYELGLGQLDAALADPRVDAPDTKRLQEFRDRLVAERREAADLERRVADGEATAAEHASLARIYAGRGLWEEAIEQQRSAPPEIDQQERLAFMLFRAERFREAHELYQELARLRRSAELEVNNGVSMAMLGDDEAAVAAYRRALEIRPDDRLARLYLGNALLRLERREPAVEAYAAFLRQGGQGEAAERVRRILQQIAPEALPEDPEAEQASAIPDAEAGS